MSMFTDRLRNDRNPFDNYDLREQAADKIEKLEERIEALEASNAQLKDAVAFFSAFFDYLPEGAKLTLLDSEKFKRARAALEPDK